MWIRIAAGAAAALVEALPGAGAVLPGEVTISALSGTMASADRLWLLLAVIAGAAVGDQVDYWLGRRLGPRLADSRVVRRIGRQHWDRGVSLVRRRGVIAIVLSRVVPMVRTLVPAAAGAARMSHLRFTLASLTGCALWSIAWVFAGATAAGLARTPLLPIVLLCLVAAASWLLYRRVSGRMRRNPRSGAVPAVVPRGGRGRLGWTADAD
ncbi:MAG: DedA family protein [Nocardioides sp.]|uniref:DedA family protein n=1 Tax=Nocardioides sp. TaxID=35761 RepID=UPI0039E331EE